MLYLSFSTLFFSSWPTIHGLKHFSVEVQDFKDISWRSPGVLTILFLGCLLNLNICLFNDVNWHWTYCVGAIDQRRRIRPTRPPLLRPQGGCLTWQAGPLPLTALSCPPGLPANQRAGFFILDLSANQRAGYCRSGPSANQRAGSCRPDPSANQRAGFFTPDLWANQMAGLLCASMGGSRPVTSSWCMAGNPRQMKRR